MVRSPTSQDHESSGAHLVIQATGAAKVAAAAHLAAVLRILASYMPAHQDRHPPGASWPGKT